MKFLIPSILIFGAFLAAIPHLLFLPAKLAGLAFRFNVAYRPFGLAALWLFCIWTALVLYGNIFGRFRSEVKELEYRHADLPEAFDGYRIVHISDLHLDGWQGHGKDLSERIACINGLDPDLICFTGDLVSLSSRELDPFISILKELKARDGVVSVLGNHDYLPYARFGSEDQRWAEVAEVARKEKEDLGWKLLMNESTIIRKGADSLAILGCENQSVGAHPVVQRGDLRKAMAGIEGMMRILLSHDPSQWRKEVLPLSDIQLTLSGHTHAMQFRLFGWTPSGWIYPECDGLYTEGSQSLYVNIGLGGTMPMRIGATPEITLITLRK